MIDAESAPMPSRRKPTKERSVKNRPVKEDNIPGLVDRFQGYSIYCIVFITK